MSKVGEKPAGEEDDKKKGKGMFAFFKGLFKKKEPTQQRPKHLDWDEVLAYRSFKMVVYQDARLGLLFLALNLVIVLYIVLFAIIANEGYIESEQAFGQIELHVLGKTHFKVDGESLVVDALDLVDPAIEHGALFVASRRENTVQQRGVCGNVENECRDDGDCVNSPPVYTGKCVEGLCQEMGWCPPSDPSSPDTQVWDFEHPENVTIWIKAAISFPKLSPNETFTTMTADHPIYESENPEFGNAYYLSEILQAAGVPLEASKKDGAMINVRMEWICDIATKAGCASPIVEAKRLDVGLAQGFWFADADYSLDDEGKPDRDVRFYQKQVGYRLIVSSKGTGSRPSIAAVILQVSSGLALLGAARGLTDALMLFVLPQKDQYRKYKEEVTPDFSDVRDLIRENKQQTEAIRGEGLSRYAVDADRRR